MPDSPLSTKVLPRRTAARRASAAITQEAQLDTDLESSSSSSEGSDEEHEEGSGSGKKKTRRKNSGKARGGSNAKAATAAKARKGLAVKATGSMESATDGINGQGQGQGLDTPAATTSTHKKPSPIKTYRGALKRKRREAQALDTGTTSSGSESVAPSAVRRALGKSASSPGPDAGKEVKAAPSSSKPRLRPRPRAKSDGKLLNKGDSNGEDDIKPKTTGMRKQPELLVTTVPAPITVDDSGDESELTPLSSPVEASGSAPIEIGSSPPRAAPAAPSPKPKRKVQDSHPMSKTTTTSSTSAAMPKSRPKPLSPKKAATARFPWEITEEQEKEPWSIKTLGKFVWVRLDGRNRRTAEVCSGNSKASVDPLWWPASVEDKQLGKTPSLKVRLFHSSSREVKVPNPCAANVLSRLDSRSNKIRFRTYEAAGASGLNSFDENFNTGVNSPRKRPRVQDELTVAWDMATALMHAEADKIQDDDDSGPLLSVAKTKVLARTTSMPNLKHPPSTNGKGASRKGKRKRQQFEADEEEEEEEKAKVIFDLELTDDDDEDGMVTEEMQVEEGTHVLARDKNPRKEYWPAKVLEYIPPKSRRQEGTYRVEYLDKTEAVVPRSYFYTVDDDPWFFQCKLGNIESAVVDDTVDDDDDEVGVDNPIGGRGPSPPYLQPPPDKKQFIDLSVRQQFAYVKPVLQAILRDEYEPTKEKVRIFMTGTKRQQASLQHNASERGMMDPTDVNELLGHLKWWCLRGEWQAPVAAAAVAVREETELGSVIGDAGSVATEPAESSARSSPTPTERLSASSPPPPPSSSISLVSEPSMSEADTVTADDVPDAVDDAMDTDPSPQTVSALDFPTRQIGSVQYESITPLQRLDFCMNILLPETIRQVLLWRNGVRTSVELLSDQEEEDLYEDGRKLLNERDWVQDILRLRKNGERKYLEVPAPPPKDTTVSSRGRAVKRVEYAE